MEETKNRRKGKWKKLRTGEKGRWKKLRTGEKESGRN